jgi:hypothetical protein
MTLPSNDDPRHEDAALDGLAPDEKEAVLKIRKRKAEEAEALERWRAIVFDLDIEDADEARDGAAACFRARVEALGWDEADVEAFTEALMRSLGYEQKDIRNHGKVWER